jgi:hypothetical protein
MPPLLPGTRCALAAPFRPCPRGRLALAGQPCTGGLLSVALSLESPPPAVSRHRVPVEPGLSSTGGIAPPAAAARLSGKRDVRPRAWAVKHSELPARRTTRYCNVTRPAAPATQRNNAFPRRPDAAIRSTVQTRARAHAPVAILVLIALCGRHQQHPFTPPARLLPLLPGVSEPAKKRGRSAPAG